LEEQPKELVGFSFRRVFTGEWDPKSPAMSKFAVFLDLGEYAPGIAVRFLGGTFHRSVRVRGVLAHIAWNIASTITG
jgi:hypothetical protein